MKFRGEFRFAIAVLLATGLACAPAHALVTLNDSHDHVFVTGSLGVSRDSNIFANSDNTGDFVYSSTLAAEYTRRAGWIGVNASVTVSASRYGKVKGENFNNPSYSMELTKQSGRTTGSFTLSGARESRADSAVNIRSTSWNYATGLNFKYPINERFTASGSLGYSARKYIENTQLANLATYTVSTDLFYVLTNERDLVAGYRYRQSETSRNTSTSDQSVNAGVSGRVIRGINGSVRVGYQVRTPHGSKGDDAEYHGVSASAATSYAVNRKITISGQLAKDFSTTATDTSVDSTTAGIDVPYVYSNHWNFSAGAGWGDSRFLGEKGRIIVAAGPPAILGPNRHDNFANWSTSAGYSLNEHFKASFTYAWFKNWSTVPFADFVRSSWTLNFSSHW
jgi:hypothetical protein